MSVYSNYRVRLDYLNTQAVGRVHLRKVWAKNRFILTIDVDKQSIRLVLNK